MKEPTRTQPATTDTGWRELDRGNWEAARTAFSQALEIAETPESFDGLAWAAWWLDDGAALFDARERAYRMYQQHGDPAGAARMATWLAIDHLDFHGAAAVANGWLRRAVDLLDSLEPAPERGWVSFLEGYLALAGGDLDAAVGHARNTSELGRDQGVADLRMLGLALEGAVLVATGQVEAGMRYLDEATAVALAEKAKIPIANAWTCCFLVSACVSIRDYERAFAWCERIAEMANRHGSRYLLAFCRAEYATIHLWRAQWAEAEALLEASVKDYSRSRPAMMSGPLVALAELRRRQGRNEEAHELLARAGSTTEAHLCRGRLALDANDLDAAVELAERVLRQLAEHDRLGRTPALELRVRAHLARGRPDDAGPSVEELDRLAQEIGTLPLRATANLCHGMRLAAAGEPATARAPLEDAVDGFERSGGIHDAALARAELARTLERLGRPEAAAREAALAHEPLVSFGTVTRREDSSGTKTDEYAVALRDITRREREVLGLLTHGLTNRQIAERLHVSEHTIHRHVTSLLRKLDLPSRAAAAAFAARAGLDRTDAPSE